jgi:hypothetical protein
MKYHEKMYMGRSTESTAAGSMADGIVDLLRPLITIWIAEIRLRKVVS